MTISVLRDEADRTDPRCGKAVDAWKALKLSWDGTSYFFCSEDCRRHEVCPPRPFDDPGRFRAPGSE
jgi:YHS domain-containing protein